MVIWITLKTREEEKNPGSSDGFKNKRKMQWFWLTATVAGNF